MKENKIVSRLYDRCICWIDRDLSTKNKEERMNLYEQYRWMFSRESRLVSLETFILENYNRAFYCREKFKDWFYVVADYALDPKHIGRTSTYHNMNHPYWEGKKKNGNKDYPQKVILALGMMGIFTGVSASYLNVPDKTKAHGRIYDVDVDRLAEWTMTATSLSNEFSEPTASSQLDYTWETTFSDSDFDYSFLEGDDEESKESWFLHDDWQAVRQYETISSLTVIPEAQVKAQQFLYSYPYQMVKSLWCKEEQKRFRVQYRNSMWLMNLQNGKVGRCKVDDKGGRFYSIMVGMGKAYRRNCLLLDGERIVEVDVSSSQPTLIGLMVKKDRQVMTQWLSHCLAGDFYEWVREITGVKVCRKRVKEYVMQYIYSCNGSDLPRDYEGEHIASDDGNGKRGYKKFRQTLTAYLKENDPDIYTLIDRHKRNPVWSDKIWTDRRGKRHQGRWCSSLPVEMQKIEVEYIKTCLARLPEGMKYYTIHDAICVRESDADVVKETMEDVSVDMYGEKISIKVENSSNDS